MRHLGYIHSFAIVNNVTINMGVQVPLYNLTYISLDIYPGVELLDHGCSIFSF
jgi:hypothetical protein